MAVEMAAPRAPREDHDALTEWVNIIAFTERGAHHLLLQLHEGHAGRGVRERDQRGSTPATAASAREPLTDLRPESEPLLTESASDANKSPGPGETTTSGFRELSMKNATASEGDDSTIDFVVMLDRRRRR